MGRISDGTSRTFPILLSPLIGRLDRKIDMRILVTVSFLVYALTFYWRAVTFESSMSFIDVALPQLLQGLALACFFMPLTTITLSDLPANKMASASSLFNFLNACRINRYIINDVSLVQS